MKAGWCMYASMIDCVIIDSSNVPSAVPSYYQNQCWLFQCGLRLNKEAHRLQLLSQCRQFVMHPIIRCGLVTPYGDINLVQVVSCCLVSPSHYLNQYWLLLSKWVPKLQFENSIFNSLGLNGIILVQVPCHSAVSRHMRGRASEFYLSDAKFCHLPYCPMKYMLVYWNNFSLW